MNCMSIRTLMPTWNEFSLESRLLKVRKASRFFFCISRENVETSTSDDYELYIKKVCD